MVDYSFKRSHRANHKFSRRFGPREQNIFMTEKRKISREKYGRIERGIIKKAIKGQRKKTSPKNERTSTE